MATFDLFFLRRKSGEYLDARGEPVDRSAAYLATRSGAELFISENPGHVMERASKRDLIERADPMQKGGSYE